MAIAGCRLLHFSILGNSFLATLNVANGAVTHPKIALHSVDQTQLTFAIHNGTNGAIGLQGPVGPHVCNIQFIQRN